MSQGIERLQIMSQGIGRSQIISQGIGRFQIMSQGIERLQMMQQQWGMDVSGKAVGNACPAEQGVCMAQSSARREP